MKAHFYTGRNKFDNISITRVAWNIANGHELPEDVAAHVERLKGNREFAEALAKEISREGNEREFSEAISKHPRLARLVAGTVNGKRNWRRLYERFCK